MKTADREPATTIVVHVPLKFTVRGGRKTIIGKISQTPTHTRFDDSIVKALARAHRWRSKLEDGTYASSSALAKSEKINASYVARVLRLVLLAPDIVEAALNGGGNFNVEMLTKINSEDWGEQRSAFEYNAIILKR